MIQNNNLNGYIPGVCNIGREELKRRKNGVFLSLALLAIIILTIELTHASHIWRFSIFIPVAYVAISWQQWYFKFCVKFGMKGVFNFGEMGKTFTVDQKEYYAKDRAKALKMIFAGIAIGIAAALVYYFV